MAGTGKLIFKVFSPRIIAKAMVALDKSTAVIVSACWVAAFVSLILAVLAVHGAVTAKREAAEAVAAEPVLPKTSTTALSPREVQNIIDRLQRQFPDIKVDGAPNQGVTLRSTDGSKFHQWITALGYVDTMAPQYRWAINEFCVGTCAGNDLMKATVAGHKVVFSLPDK